MAEDVTSRGKPAFRAGLRLFAGAAGRAFRMRNVWIVLALCAVGDVGAQVMEARATPAFVGVDSLALGKSARVAARRMERRWRVPAAVPGNLVRGVQRPLNASFRGAQSPVMWVSHRVFGLTWDTDPERMPELKPLLLAILLTNLIYAVLTAGLLGWVRAAVRGERQSARAFGHAATHGVGTIYVWLLILDVLALAAYSLTAHSSVAVAAAVGSIIALLLLPFLFLPFRTVARRESIGAAALGSLRLALAQAPALAGFLVCYRVAAEVAAWLASTLQLSLPLTNGPSAALPFAVLAGGFAGAIVKSAVALVLCVGLMVMVEGSEESILLRSKSTSYAGLREPRSRNGR